MTTLVSWDGSSELAVNMLVSWNKIPSILRWTDGTNSIIENRKSEITITVPNGELEKAMTTSEESEQALADLIAGYSGEPDGLAFWLAARGVTLTI